LAWDPLSDHYLLACSSSGHMALYDVQAGQQVGVGAMPHCWLCASKARSCNNSRTGLLLVTAA
jgi:hypothetical protein